MDLRQVLADDEFSDVYLWLLEALPPAPAPAILDSLEVDMTGVRSLSADPAELVRHLRQRFPDDLLIRSGILRRRARRLVWGFSLNRPGEICLPLAGEDGRCFEVLTSRGCLSNRELPLTACLRDATFRRHAADSCSLFVAFSLPDLVCFRALGLPATSAWGLDQVGRSQLREIRQAFRLIDEYEDEQAVVDFDDHPVEPIDETSTGEPADSAAQPGLEGGTPAAQEDGGDGAPLQLGPDPAAEDSPPEPSEQVVYEPVTVGQSAMLELAEMVLVNWSPATGDAKEPAALAAVVDHWRGLHAHLQYSLLMPVIWRPVEESLQSLRFALDYGDLPRVRAAIERSVARSSAPLIEPTKRSIPELITRLILPRTPQDRHLASADRARAHQAILESCVRPLLAELEETGTPLDRSRKIILVDRLIELFDRMFTPVDRHPLAAEETAKRKRELISEILKLIKDLEPPVKPPATRRDKFSAFRAD